MALNLCWKIGASARNDETFCGKLLKNSIVFVFELCTSSFYSSGADCSFLSSMLFFQKIFSKSVNLMHDYKRLCFSVDVTSGMCSDQCVRHNSGFICRSVAVSLLYLSSFFCLHYGPPTVCTLLLFILTSYPAALRMLIPHALPRSQCANEHC